MVPQPNNPGTLNRGYSVRSSSSRPYSYAGNSTASYGHGALDQSQPHNPRFREELDAASRRSSVAMDGPAAGIQRSTSQMSHVRSPTPSRSGTLRKKASLSKKGSLRRNGSRRSLRAGSVRSLSLGDREKYHADGTEDVNSAFTVPIPTDGNPTEVLANRFQGMGYMCRPSTWQLTDDLHSLAQDYQGVDCLFQGGAKVLRDTVEAILICHHCYEQPGLPARLPAVGWPCRCI